MGSTTSFFDQCQIGYHRPIRAQGARMRFWLPKASDTTRKSAQQVTKHSVVWGVERTALRSNGTRHLGGAAFASNPEATHQNLREPNHAAGPGNLRSGGGAQPLGELR